MGTAIIVALLTTLSAVLSPIITSLINNHHQLKMRKLDFIEKKRLVAVENFIFDANSYFSNRNMATLGKLNKSISNLYLFLPKELWKDVDAFALLFVAGDTYDYVEAEKRLPTLVQKLSPHTQIFIEKP